jgi:hypothetical protein
MGNLHGDRVHIVLNEVLAADIETGLVICSLPHHESELQPSISDSWSPILGNLAGDWLHIVTDEILAAIIGRTESERLPVLE